MNEEQKLQKEFPELAEGMLAHSFKTTTPDEDGSDLPMLAMPLGWVVEWKGDYMMSDQPLKLTTQPELVREIK